MAGQDSSTPIEPTKAHPRLLGRGGVGNYQEARKWETVNPQDPPLTSPKIEPVDHVKVIHSTGRGGQGNFKVGPDETSTERNRRLSTLARDEGSTTFGRGGAGNIEAAKIVQKKKDEERARQEAIVAEKARAQAKAAVEAIQVPKPTRTVSGH